MAWACRASTHTARRPSPTKAPCSQFDVRPVYRCIQEQFLSLRDEIEWGYNDIYGISGCLNQHPRAAMKQRADESKRDFCYDFLIECVEVDEASLD